MFDKPYDPKEVESKIYEKWLDSGYFNPDKLPVAKNPAYAKATAGKGKNYIVYMPLPNVTGSLHIGHALDNTSPDILIRYHRMKGYKTLWLPGTDHAGIATQYAVEKELKKEGKNRFDLGREKFIARVWEWKNKYGNLILEQLKRLGVSADWSRTRFTMDPDYSRDVLNAFIHYYKEGLIYRGFRTINWCVRCGTSLSELELEYADEKAFLYYIKYGPFILATVRPETKFGDTALAVNPNDKRYKKYIGQTLEVDSLDTEGDLDKPSKKKIKLLIVGDEAVLPSFGTGVVKVTPAHDITDFEISQRHKLPLVQVIDYRGRMNEKTGKYAGMKTEEARRKINEDLRTIGLLEKEEPYEHRVAKCYRCHTTIEPLPSKQWFLKMDALAKMAINAVKGGKVHPVRNSPPQRPFGRASAGEISNRVKITPKNFEKTYFNWLQNIRDWAISRQIWWGHQLPVFFCKRKPAEVKCQKSKVKSDDKEFVVSVERPKKCPFCNHCQMERSQDVLDTWFSSALWPFAGFSESDRKKYYPGNFVTNAREILNLWDARMIFSGLEFMGKIPFKTILIHSTILTKEGKRMSKSLGTGIDPLEYLDKFGADATRFAVVWQATQQDIRWDETAVTAGRKFTNKIWNASRFVLENKPSQINAPSFANLRFARGFGKAMATAGKDFSGLKRIKNLTPADKKILTAVTLIKKKTERRIENFEFSKALRELYNFFWHDLCDIYLEKSKEQLQDEKISENTKQILIYTLRESLKMLHPFMPFVTEEIWSHLPAKNEELLMVTQW